MSKYADKYFKPEPWRIVESGFNPAYSRVAESVFSLGNEYMGLRGYFDEGYSGDSLQGSYINGVYESRAVPKSGYRGMLNAVDFMVNTVDWVYTRISCNGIPLDLAGTGFSDFNRELDMRTGVLTRSFIWHVDGETDLALKFERFLSMTVPELGGWRLGLDCIKGKAQIKLVSGLDFSRPHMMAGKNLWDCSGVSANGDSCELLGTTQTTKQRVFAVSKFHGFGKTGPDLGDKRSALGFSFSLEPGAPDPGVSGPGRTLTLTRLTAVIHDKSGDFDTRCEKARRDVAVLDYDRLKSESAGWWARQWELSDIQIDGDPENQQGIRFCIFQMHQTLHTAENSAVIGAKGLTGEAYNGNTFWDSEVYCLPFYLFNNPAAAKNILRFRYDTLNEARKRAAALDCKGAFYPVATIGGRECCDLWQHANLQLHPSTSVMYGIRLYEKLTGDREFLLEMGAEMLIEICRMLATRGDWNPSGEYGYYGVMGLDEFQMMVGNNSYTNFMAKKSFQYTLEVLADIRENNVDAYRSLSERLGLSDAELADWQQKAERMRLCYDKESMLFEQHEGYYGLPHIDVKSIPVGDFPLYSHWSYDRIYRNDMIKQPDVLMFMLLYNSDFTGAQLEANYNFYEPRCIHESSLSPSVHSILASQIGYAKQAYDFFGFATRMDLDNYNRNTNEGLHTTSIAGAWMNIVFGFGGLRCDGDMLSLAPALPDAWDGYRFKLLHGSRVIEVSVSRGGVRLCCDGEIELMLYGEKIRLTKAGYTVSLEAANELGA